MHATQSIKPVTALALLVGVTACGTAQSPDQAAQEGPADTPAPAVSTENVAAPPAEAEPAEQPLQGAALLSLDFDEAEVGSVPEGVLIAETFGSGTPATWEVVQRSTAPSQANAFGTTASQNRGRTYNLALVAGSSFGDLDLSVAVHREAGREDQGGGPAWRVRDADNYYIARWNPLEDNFRVYVVSNGQRRQLASAHVRRDPSAWYVIRIVMRGAHIEAYFDNDLLLELDDPTFSEPGLVGLWVKADGQTLFDDLAVRSISDEGVP